MGSRILTPLPNFFVVGVPKAGTTSLYHYLAQHPQVYMSPLKEPAFFGAADFASGEYAVVHEVVRDRAALARHVSGREPLPAMTMVLDWELYLELFRGVQNEIAIGEASVGYFYLPHAARAIRARIPAARLIVVLRDVADRLFTVYAGMRWRNPTWTFGRWFAAARAGGAEGADLRRYVDGGRYATHLQRFFDLFPRDQVRVHLYEDYRADPRAVLRDLFAFLGVDPAAPIDLSRRHNETMVPRFPQLSALRRRVFRAARLPRWIPGPARRGLRWLSHRPRGDLVMDPADRQVVIDHYRDEILRTSELIGRDLGRWLTP